MTDTTIEIKQMDRVETTSNNQQHAEIKVEEIKVADIAKSVNQITTDVQLNEVKVEGIKIAEPPKEPLQLKADSLKISNLLTELAMVKPVTEEKHDKPGMMMMQTVIMEEDSSWMCCRRKKSSQPKKDVLSSVNTVPSVMVPSVTVPSVTVPSVTVRPVNSAPIINSMLPTDQIIVSPFRNLFRCSCFSCDEENYCGPNIDSNTGHGVFDCSPSSQCGTGWISLVMMFLGLVLVFIYCGVAVYAKWKGDIDIVLGYYYGISSAAIFMFGVFTKAASLWQIMSSHEKYILSDKTWFNALVSMINEELSKEKCAKMKADLKLSPIFQFDRAPDIGSWEGTSTRLMYLVIVGVTFIVIGLITMCAPGLLIYSMLFTFFGTGLFFLASWGIQSMYAISVENRREKSLRFQDLARDLECPNLKIAERQFEHEIVLDFPEGNPTQYQTCVNMHIYKLKQE